MYQSQSAEILRGNGLLPKEEIPLWVRAEILEALGVPTQFAVGHDKGTPCLGPTNCLHN
jgi:hypothetical protein